MQKLCKTQNAGYRFFSFCTFWDTLNYLSNHRVYYYVDIRFANTKFYALAFNVIVATICLLLQGV